MLRAEPERCRGTMSSTGSTGLRARGKKTARGPWTCGRQRVAIEILQTPGIWWKQEEEEEPGTQLFFFDVR